MNDISGAEWRRIKEQIGILTGDRGPSGKPNRAVLLHELTSGTLSSQSTGGGSSGGGGGSSGGSYVPESDVGSPDGVASLDSSGLLPDSQLPEKIEPATYGDSTHIVSITVDLQGRITSITPIQIPDLNALAEAVAELQQTQPTVLSSIGGIMLVAADGATLIAGA